MPGHFTNQKTAGKRGRLDHSFRPQEHLSKTLSLGEATVWLGRFDNYLEWNELVTKDNACSRDLLEGCLEADLVAMLQEAGRTECWQSYGDTSSTITG